MNITSAEAKNFIHTLLKYDADNLDEKGNPVQRRFVPRDIHSGYHSVIKKLQNELKFMLDDGSEVDKVEKDDTRKVVNIGFKDQGLELDSSEIKAIKHLFDNTQNILNISIESMDQIKTLLKVK